ncbi:unnamed protein product, partial [Allacma fusca]
SDEDIYSDAIASQSKREATANGE